MTNSLAAGARVRILTNSATFATNISPSEYSESGKSLELATDLASSTLSIVPSGMASESETAFP